MKRNGDGEPVGPALSQTCEDVRPLRGLVVDEAKVCGFPSRPGQTSHAPLKAAEYMTPTGLSLIGLNQQPCAWGAVHIVARSQKGSRIGAPARYGNGSREHASDMRGLLGARAPLSASSISRRLRAITKHEQAGAGQSRGGVHLVRRSVYEGGWRRLAYR